MSVRSLPRTEAYPARTPRYASVPPSGAGAATAGGRFNRRGVQALYLSPDITTALAEYQRDDALLQPATLVAYRVSLSRVVDLTAARDLGGWAPLWQDWQGAWRELAFLDRIEPPSWVLGDWVMGSAAGLLFPSLANPGGANLVGYLDALDAGDQLEVHDPEGRLPSNQASWSQRN